LTNLAPSEARGEGGGNGQNWQVSAPPSPKIVFLFFGLRFGKHGKATIILQKKKKKRQTARPKFRFEEKTGLTLFK